MPYSNKDRARKYYKDYYWTNRTKWKGYNKKSRKVQANTLRVLIIREKSKPCADCKRWYKPWQMDFDHVRGTKRFSIGQSITCGLGITAFKEEIKKCDIICANCHRDRTHKNSRFMSKLSTSNIIGEYYGEGQT